MIHAVFVDMDLVLVDFIKAFEVKYDADLGEKFGYNPGHDMDRTWDSIKFELNYEFWSSAPPMPWAKTLMKWLTSEFEDVYILTGAEPIAGYSDGKLAWLHFWHPDMLDNLIITKHKHLMASPERLLIDDYPKNTRSWVQHGGYAVEVAAVWKNTKEEVANYDIIDAVETEIRRSHNG